ncbi:dihydrolipoyl dehydrogenase [bacterium]|nr:dihydrolipoyl dehydrogenase [bacterium]
MGKTRIVVLGGGPGGYVAALRAASLGADVCLIERENLGGTCLNWGCIPSKIMRHTSELYLKMGRTEHLGIDIHGSLSLNLAALMARKHKILAAQRKGIATLLSTGGVRVIQGTGRIEERGLVTIDSTAGSEAVPFDKLIVATGTVPLQVEAFPFDNRTVLSSNDLLQLASVPKSITIVGAGVIGCEFAFILSGMGAEVTMVEAMSRVIPIPTVDELCSKILLRELKKRKVRVLTDTIVSGIEPTDTGVSISLQPSPFSESPAKRTVLHPPLVAGTMAVCIGRAPLSTDIGLEKIGLKPDNKGWITVNDSMETAVENVYAIGDILGPSKMMLAHVASHEGMIAAENAMGGACRMDYVAAPGAIFTNPEIGNVGESELSAREKGLKIDCFTTSFRTLGKAQVIDDIAGEAKLVVERGSGRILGVHLIGHGATDLIGEGAVVVKNRLTVDELAHTIHAHPTLSEVLSEVAMKALGKPVHG